MELEGYIEGIILVIVMWFVFQDIVQPVLIVIDPMFADQPVDRVRRGPQTPAQAAGIVTFVAGAFVYYSGRFVLRFGIMTYLKTARAFLLLPIDLYVPNKYLPAWLIPDNTDLDDE